MHFRIERLLSFRRGLSTASSRAVHGLNLSRPSLLRSQSYIDGHWIDSAQKKVFSVVNPATELILANVADCGPSETQIAILAAHRSMKDWAALPGKRRSSILRRWFTLLESNANDLALILTAENGKPLVESRGEVAYGASFVEWFSEEARRVDGDILCPLVSDHELLILRQPVGVVAAITPWNFPNAMITRKVAPALAAGCSVVLKPSDLTPLSALALADLAHEAGIPAGVFNVVTAGADQTTAVGATLTSSDIVRKITFTGSTRVGKLLLSQCASTVKRTSMELGGNAPFIIFDDADLDAAVQGVLFSKYRNCGQTCISANRIYVHSKVFDKFSALLSSHVAGLVLGDGSKEETTLGPLINHEAINKVRSQLNNAVSHGAKVMYGGDVSTVPGPRFFYPTVLDCGRIGTESANVFSEETFGPIAPLVRFSTEEEVIAAANNTKAGLAAYFYSKDMGRCFRVSRSLQYGMVGVNESRISTEVGPFGGIKESGSGREGSKYGLNDFLELKYVNMNTK